MSEASQKELDLGSHFFIQKIPWKISSHFFRHGNDQRLDVSYNYVIKIIDFINVQWLKQEFLPYMDAWEASVDALEGFTDVEKKRMLLSQETLLGIRRTGI